MGFGKEGVGGIYGKNMIKTPCANNAYCPQFVNRKNVI